MRISLIVVLLFIINGSLIAQPLGLIPYRTGNVWGYSDREGKIIIAPAYERTFFFTNDSLARVMQKGMYGFIDMNGKVKIKPQFNNASDFIMGAAAVESGQKKYCIDRDGNNTECNPPEDEFAPEENPYSGLVIDKDSMGYMLIIEANRDTIDDRFDEIKIIGRYFFPQVNHFAFVRKKNLYGAYNQLGMPIAPVEFTKIDILDMDTYKATKRNGWGANDFNGRNVIPFEYDSILKVSEFLFLEDQEQKNNHFIVSKKNKFGIVDSERKSIMKLEYDIIKIPKECTCPTEYVVGKNGLLGLTDYSGKLVIPLKYADIEPFQTSEITFVKTTAGKEGYIRRDGMEFFAE